LPELLINGIKKKLTFTLKHTLPITLKELKGFRVVLFQDKTLEYPNLHWYIMIRVKDTDSFIVIIITSKKTKRRQYYKRTQNPGAAECLVEINNDDFPFFTKESAINCNDAKNLDIDEIVNIVDETKGFKVEKEKVEAYLKKEIVSAINKSPLIPKAIKTMAKEANPL
jgi:hypothetical protein